MSCLIKKLICMGLCTAMMTACSHKIDLKGKMDNLAKDFEKLGREKPYTYITNRPYLDVQPMELNQDVAPILKTNVTLRTKGALQEILDNIMELVNVQINLVSENDLKVARPRMMSTQTPEIAKLLDGQEFLLPGDFPAKLNINHTGELKNLLDQIAAQSGYGWDYDKNSNTITFARTMVKTFVLQSAPGRVNFNTQLTNKSRENRSTGSLADNVRAEKVSGDTQAQISQTYQGTLGFDVFKDTLQTVRSMLSTIGQAEGNEAAGTITVRDRPENLRQIKHYIDEINVRYARQVAMKVNVYALEINDDTDVGLDVAAIIPKLNLGQHSISLSAGALQAAKGTLGTATAAILDGNFQGSESMLMALKKIGNAKQITSAGIVALNNQPAPVEAIKRISYLAGTSVETTDSGSQTELTPGEVTTGFSMTITPHILGARKLVLQYNVQLSTLDAMESFATNNTTIQLPQVSSRAFAQKATMLMGQTLLIAGFQQATQTDSLKGGIL